MGRSADAIGQLACEKETTCPSPFWPLPKEEVAALHYRRQSSGNRAWVSRIFMWGPCIAGVVVWPHLEEVQLKGAGRLRRTYAYKGALCFAACMVLAHGKQICEHTARIDLRRQDAASRAMQDMVRAAPPPELVRSPPSTYLNYADYALRHRRLKIDRHYCRVQEVRSSVRSPREPCSIRSGR